MMLSLVIALLIIALIAQYLPSAIVAAAFVIEKIIFFVAIALFLISLVFGGLRGGFGRPL